MDREIPQGSTSDVSNFRQYTQQRVLFALALNSQRVLCGSVNRVVTQVVFLTFQRINLAADGKREA